MTRDDIAQAMQDTSGADWGTEAHFQRFAKVILETEREECARVCEQMETQGDPVQCWLDACAAAIRARGE